MQFCAFSETKRTVITMENISLLIKPSSSLCNMRCKYCFYADVSNNRLVKSYGMMTLETLELLVKKALSECTGICSFGFQGGEPTLAGLGFYKKLIDFQKEYNVNHIKINNSIQTNGITINEEWAVFLKENNFLAGLSLDGYSDVHNSLRVDANNEYTYNRVMKAAALFNKYGVEYNILCVVNNFVAKHSERIIQFFEKNNFRYLQFIPCIDDLDANKENYSLDNKRYLDFLKITFNHYYYDVMSGNAISIRNFDNWIGILMGRPPESCGMLGRCGCYFTVEGDGSVYPCDFYVLDKWRLGLLTENTFAEMLAGKTSKEFIESSTPVDEKCKSCNWYNLCRGGCRRYREPFSKGTPSLNIFCEAYYEFFSFAYDKMINIVKKISNQYLHS